MSDREEFEEWWISVEGFVSGGYIERHAWTGWQAARYSRWRSMDSAPGNQEVRGWFGRYGAHQCTCKYGIWHDSDGKSLEFVMPLAWHPLPDPPTAEELENLK